MCIRDSLNGVLPPGSQMPSVRQLATELSVNPNTIQRAYMELEKIIAKPIARNIVNTENIPLPIKKAAFPYIYTP